MNGAGPGNQGILLAGNVLALTTCDHATAEQADVRSLNVQQTDGLSWRVLREPTAQMGLRYKIAGIERVSVE